MKRKNEEMQHALKSNTVVRVESSDNQVHPHAIKAKSEQPNEKWFWVTCGANFEAIIRELDHTAFCLAAMLAQGANLHPGPNCYNLALGEALLGDGSEWGMTGHKLRAARKRLERRGYASFRMAEHGWVGRLNDGRLFRIFPDSDYDDQGNLAPR